MKRNIYILSILFLMTCSVLADESGIMVRPVVEEMIETPPHNTVTCLFRITNTGSTSQEFVSEINLPKGWKLITKEFPFIVNSDQSETRLVSFYVSSTTIAGTYDILYRVRGREFPSVSDEYSFRVIVLPVRSVSISLVESPKFVIAGEDYKISYLIENKSNRIESIALEFESSDNYPVQSDQDQYNLNPGESVHFSVITKTESELSRVKKHMIIAKIKSLKDQKEIASLTNHVDLIPKKIVSATPYHQFPVRTTLKGFYSDRKSNNLGAQIDIEGAGTLNEKGESHIQFHFRGPDAYKKSVLADYDEYVVGYRNNKFSVYIGDRRFSLSHLTEKSRYGRGVEGKLNYKNYSFGGFYQKARWIFHANQEFGAYVNYSEKNKYKLGFNYLRKDMSDGSADIFSCVGKVVLFKKSSLDLEVASGIRNKKTQYSYWMDLKSINSKINYLIRMIHADADFPGYYTDTQYLTASFSAPILQRFNINGNIRHQKQNYDLDTTRYSAPLSKNLEFGLNYRFKMGLTLDLDYYNRSSFDRLPDHLFDYTEHSVRFTVGQSFQKLNLSLSAETGQTNNKNFGKTSDMIRYMGSLYFIPTYKQSYRLFAYYDENMRYSLERQHQFTFGLNVNIQMFKGISLYFNYQNNSSNEEYYQDRDLIEAKLSYRFKRSHMLSLRCRQTLLPQSLDKKETAFLLEYNSSFNIPVSRKKDVGTVKGRVLDVETGNPVKNLIIKINGSSVVSNKNGEFVFPSVLPKKYYLRVDRSRIGLNYVTLPRTPLEVNVQGGEELWIDLGVARATTFSGRIVLYSAVHDTTHTMKDSLQNHELEEYFVVGNIDQAKKQSGELNQNGMRTTITNQKIKMVEDYPLPNSIVEIKQGDYVKRQVTDVDGQFLFEELQPGKWTVKLYDNNMPENYQFEKETFEIELKPGEITKKNLKVIPKKRRIRYMQQGGQLIEERN